MSMTAETVDQFAGLPLTRLSIGDVCSSRKPAHLKTLLGSCVAVCLYHSGFRTGGMNHISLPGQCAEKDARFGINAMELLLHQLMGMGCDRRGLVAKIFGGANVLSCIRAQVGTINAEFVREFLKDKSIPVVAERLGGTAAMEVSLRTDTGYVLLRTLGEKAYLQQQTRPESSMCKGTDSQAEDVFLC